MSEPDFVWWVPFTLHNRDIISASVIERTKRVYHKYGVQIPCTVREAYDFDKENGDTLCHDVLNK